MHAHRRRGSGAAGPFSEAALKPCRISGHRHLGSSSAAPGETTRWSREASVPPFERCLWRRAKENAFQRLPGHHEAPQCDKQLARKRYDHGLACAAAGIRRPRLIPTCQYAVLLEPEEPPSQLDHAAAYAGVASLGET